MSPLCPHPEHVFDDPDGSATRISDPDGFCASCVFVDHRFRSVVGHSLNIFALHARCRKGADEGMAPVVDAGRLSAS